MSTPTPPEVTMDAFLRAARQAITALAATWRNPKHLRMHPETLEAVLGLPDGADTRDDRIYGLPFVADPNVPEGQIVASPLPPPERDVRALIVGGSLSGRWVTLSAEHETLTQALEPLLVAPGESYTVATVGVFGVQHRVYVLRGMTTEETHRLLAEHLLNPRAHTIVRTPRGRPVPWMN